jgi:hypothetical protein
MPGHVLGCRAAGLFDCNQIKAMNYTKKSLNFSNVVITSTSIPNEIQFLNIHMWGLTTSVSAVPTAAVTMFVPVIKLLA